MIHSRKYFFTILIFAVFLVNTLLVLQVRKSTTSDSLYTQADTAATIQNDSSSTNTTITTNRTLLTLILNSTDDSIEYEYDSVDNYILPFQLKEEKNVNQHSYTYLLNTPEAICGPNQGKDLLLLAFMPISPCNFHGRNNIRQTWANSNSMKRFKLVFLLGTSPNETVNNEVKFESQLYGDIIQEDFLDSYRNLTLKTIMGLKWVASFCAQSKFVLKIDDDMVMNPVNVMRYLEKMENSTTRVENSFFCYDQIQTRPNRTRTNTKFFVTRYDYESLFYPTYCDGPEIGRASCRERV